MSAKSKCPIVKRTPKGMTPGTKSPRKFRRERERLQRGRFSVQLFLSGNEQNHRELEIKRTARKKQIEELKKRRSA